MSGAPSLEWPDDRIVMLRDTSISEWYLVGRLNVLEGRVRRLVEHRRRLDADPDDRFRGLYTTYEQIDELLRPGRARRDVPQPDPELDAFASALDAEADRIGAAHDTPRLRRLAEAFGLEALDVELLIVALAPDLDPRFEKVFGYLNDDVTRKRASVGLALTVCGQNLLEGRARARLGPAGALVEGRLIELEDAERPFLSRALRVPDRVVSHLLGEDTPDPAIRPYLARWADAHIGIGEGLARALRAGTCLVYGRESVGSAACSFLDTSLRAAGLDVVSVDLGRLDGSDDPSSLAALACREARLKGAALLIAHVETLSERAPEVLRTITGSPGVVALVGTGAWNPQWSRRAPLLVEVPTLLERQRRQVWADAMADDHPACASAWRAMAAYRLTPDQVAMATDAARQLAVARDQPVSVEDLRTGARAQNAAGLEHLARRVAPRAGWADLVLPGAVRRQLQEIVARVRQRPRVLDEWGMGNASSRGRGITALFTGDSGTGKTMSAEVVAGDLGLDLYVVDLSTVVDKYIGETEKNLDRIFAEAETVNGVLLFDEADAIFGKRSEVHDARDRYANVEVAYLLQRMEQFDGIAVLTTNLRANVDEAFLRRLDVLVEFPMPDVDSRKWLWSQQLPPGVPRADALDFDFLARSFELSGGNIRNIVLAAAYQASDGDRPVAMEDVVRATAGEYRKLGRLCVEAEFGPYHQLVTDRVTS
jgi:ATP-dependent 26S proteasome regulatory subunit